MAWCRSNVVQNQIKKNIDKEKELEVSLSSINDPSSGERLWKNTESGRIISGSLIFTDNEKDTSSFLCAKDLLLRNGDKCIPGNYWHAFVKVSMHICIIEFALISCSSAQSMVGCLSLKCWHDYIP